MSDLPLVAPPFEGGDGRSGTVAGLLLAAGTSRRFGEGNKLLATHEGTPLVTHAARTLAESTVDPLFVVVGHEAGRVVEALSALDVRFVLNPAYERGQATSVGAGIAAIRDHAPAADAAVVALGDMPFVDTATVETLRAAYESGAGTALAPAYDGTRGNPVVFDRQFFDQLTDVAGDVGGRAILLESDDSVLVAVPDSGVRRDVDTPSDL